MHPSALEQGAHRGVARPAGGQVFAHVGDHGLEPGFGVAGRFGVTFGQGDDAQGRRHPALVLKAARGAGHP
ncbi:hypothetical protein D3C75_1312600 [compost metagenome]